MMNKMVNIFRKVQKERKGWFDEQKQKRSRENRRRFPMNRCKVWKWSYDVTEKILSNVHFFPTKRRFARRDQPWRDSRMRDAISFKPKHFVVSLILRDLVFIECASKRYGTRHFLPPLLSSPDPFDHSQSSHKNQRVENKDYRKQCMSFESGLMIHMLIRRVNEPKVW